VAKGSDYYRDAEQCYQSALKTTRRFCDAACGLADLYIRQNKEDEAEKLLNKERGLDGCAGGCACFYGCLADIYTKLGNSELSKEYLDKQKEMGVCSKSVFASKT
jgi:tetratricopeptide (TPR) repeat protein